MTSVTIAFIPPPPLEHSRTLAGLADYAGGLGSGDHQDEVRAGRYQGRQGWAVSWPSLPGRPGGSPGWGSGGGNGRR